MLPRHPFRLFTSRHPREGLVSDLARERRLASPARSVSQYVGDAITLLPGSTVTLYRVGILGL